jgi:hypothetical protein
MSTRETLLLGFDLQVASAQEDQDSAPDLIPIDLDLHHVQDLDRLGLLQEEVADDIGAGQTHIHLDHDPVHHHLLVEGVEEEAGVDEVVVVVVGVTTNGDGARVAEAMTVMAVAVAREATAGNGIDGDTFETHRPSERNRPHSVGAETVAAKTQLWRVCRVSSLILLLAWPGFV